MAQTKPKSFQIDGPLSSIFFKQKVPGVCTLCFEKWSFHKTSRLKIEFSNEYIGNQ